MNTVNGEAELEVGRKVSAEAHQVGDAALSSLYRNIGVERKNWHALWNDEMNQGDRYLMCCRASVDRHCADKSWANLTVYEHSMIRAAFRRLWKRERH